MKGKKVAKSNVIEMKKNKELDAIRKMTPAERFREAIELSHACDKLKKAVKSGSSKRG